MIQPQMPETKNWSFHRDVENLGWLTINTPGAPVNTLSRAAIMELEQLVERFEELAQTGELVGVILLSGKDSGFIAGADVSEFDAMSDFSVLPEALRRTHALFARIEALKDSGGGRHPWLLPRRWLGAGAGLPLSRGGQ